MPPVDFQSIDWGNSHPHVGHFKQGRLEAVAPWNPNEVDLSIPQLAAIVGPHWAKDLPRLGNLYQETSYGFDLLDMPVHYPQTIGEDRLAAAYYIYKKEIPSLSTPALILDVGTFITLDTVTKDGFKGGYILPGREKILGLFGEGEMLKSFDPESSFCLSETLPSSTPQAMGQGAQIYFEGLFSFIENHLKKETPLFLTGGSAPYFLKRLQSLAVRADQVHSLPHLVHLGLYEIYKGSSK